MTTRYAWLPTIPLVAVLVSGCGLSSAVHTRANTVIAQYNAHEQELSGNQRYFNDRIKAAEYPEIPRYAKRDKWDADFKLARKEMDAAQNIIKGSIARALERNKSGDEGQLNSSLNQAQSSLRKAREHFSRPLERISALERFLRDRRRIVSNARKTHNETAKLTSDMQGRLHQLIKAYPSTSEHLKDRDIALQNLRNDSAAHLANIEAHDRALRTMAPIDPGLVEQSVLSLNTIYQSTSKEFETTGDKVEEIWSTYTKALVDMRTNFLVTVGRESWNENSESEWTNETIFTPLPVDRTIYEYFSPMADDTLLASYGTGFWSSGYSYNVDQAMWNRLGTDASIPSGDNTAQWTLDGTDEEYFHKYLVIQDGRVSQTDWVRVDEAYFEQHEDDLGMDIVSKMPGYETNQEIRYASPAGMTYVNNPRFGNWVTESGGQSYWVFLPAYAVINQMLGPNKRYSRTEWLDWRNKYRGKASYYGPKQKEEDEDTYGTHSSSYGGNRYYNNTWWYTSGEYQRQRDSIRTAGSDSRGGGPGGGGK